jgi:hypothetical protein
LPLVDEELRHLAAVQVAREKPGQTLDATALVQEDLNEKRRSSVCPWIRFVVRVQVGHSVPPP